MILTLGLDATVRAGFGGVMDALLASVQQLAAERILSAQELARMAIPTVGRTEKELLAPFAPSGRFEGLSVEHLDLFDAEDRFWARHQVDGDATGLGARWAAFARAAVLPTLTAALDGGPADPRAADIIGRLQGEVAVRIAARPQPMSIPLAALVAVKSRRVSG